LEFDPHQREFDTGSIESARRGDESGQAASEKIGKDRVAERFVDVGRDSASSSFILCQEARAITGPSKKLGPVFIICLYAIRNPPVALGVNIPLRINGISR
jgi:hypothetical protein